MRLNTGPSGGAGSARTGLSLLALTGVLWGSIGIVVRLLQDAHTSTESIGFWRFVCACLVLTPVMGRRGLRQLIDCRRQPGRLLLVSVSSLTFQLLFFFAVNDLGAAGSTLIALGLAPIALTVAQAVSARSVPTLRTLLIMAIALAGLAMVTTGGLHSGSGHHPGRGLVEAAASALFYAASTAASSTLSQRLAPTTITFATSALGVLCLAPFLAVQGWYVPSNAGNVAGTVWLGVVTTVLAYGCFYVGLRTVPGHIAMVVTLLEPATAVVLAALVLHERLTATNVSGAVLLLGAVAVLFWTNETAVDSEPAAKADRATRPHRRRNASSAASPTTPASHERRNKAGADEPLR